MWVMRCSGVSYQDRAPRRAIGAALVCLAVLSPTAAEEAVAEVRRFAAEHGLAVVSPLLSDELASVLRETTLTDEGEVSLPAPYAAVRGDSSLYVERGREDGSLEAWMAEFGDGHRRGSADHAAWLAEVAREVLVGGERSRRDAYCAGAAAEMVARLWNLERQRRSGAVWCQSVPRPGSLAQPGELQLRFSAPVADAAAERGALSLVVLAVVTPRTASQLDIALPYHRHGERMVPLELVDAELGEGRAATIVGNIAYGELSLLLERMAGRGGTLTDGRPVLRGEADARSRLVAAVPLDWLTWSLRGATGWADHIERTRAAAWRALDEAGLRYPWVGPRRLGDLPPTVREAIDALLRSAAGSRFRRVLATVPAPESPPAVRLYHLPVDGAFELATPVRSEIIGGVAAIWLEAGLADVWSSPREQVAHPPEARP